MSLFVIIFVSSLYEWGNRLIGRWLSNFPSSWHLLSNILLELPWSHILSFRWLRHLHLCLVIFYSYFILNSFVKPVPTWVWSVTMLGNIVYIYNSFQNTEFKNVPLNYFVMCFLRFLSFRYIMVPFDVSVIPVLLLFGFW